MDKQADRFYLGAMQGIASDRDGNAIDWTFLVLLEWESWDYGYVAL